MLDFNWIMAATGLRQWADAHQNAHQRVIEIVDFIAAHTALFLQVRRPHHPAVSIGFRPRWLCSFSLLGLASSW